MSKPKAPEVQNPKRANATAAKTLEKVSLRLPGDTATP